MDMLEEDFKAEMKRGVEEGLCIFLGDGWLIHPDFRKELEEKYLKEPEFPCDDPSGIYVP